MLLARKRVRELKLTDAEVVRKAGLNKRRYGVSLTGEGEPDLTTLLPIASFARAPGVPIFDKPDPNRPGVLRSASILAALRDGVPMPPILLFQRRGEQRYELRDGYHRFHLIAALGYTHIAATVTDWKPGEY